MKIEVVEFYPFDTMSKQGKIGTLHVFITDILMHLRGIEVFFKKNKLYFYIPSVKIKNRKKRIDRFPVIDFQNLDQKKSLISEICKEGEKYVNSNFKVPFVRNKTTIKK